jgi:hypothetical protein
MGRLGLRYTLSSLETQHACAHTHTHTHTHTKPPLHIYECREMFMRDQKGKIEAQKLTA